MCELVPARGNKLPKGNKQIEKERGHAPMDVDRVEELPAHDPKGFNVIRVIYYFEGVMLKSEMRFSINI